MRHRHILFYTNDVFVDNRMTAKPHFAAPSAPKPAPTILQPIHTGASVASSSSGATVATRRARASLGPSVSRMPRSSSIGLAGAGYQRFALPGGRRLTETVGEGPSMAEFGVRGMTEKDIEDKVGNSSSIFPFPFRLCKCYAWTGGFFILLRFFDPGKKIFWFGSGLSSMEVVCWSGLLPTPDRSR
jgi:hypothetical protein